MDLSKTLLSYVDIYNEEIRNNLEQEFLRTKDECYLDHAGATLYSNGQIKEISNNLMNNIYGNPHSAGISSNFTHDSVESIRYRILEHFNTNSDEYTVIFTSGATESIKIIGETFDFGSKDNGHFVYTQDNHTSILGMRELVTRNNARITCLPRDKLLSIFHGSHKNKSNPNANKEERSNSLFVYSAQCNFSGFKSPLKWTEDVHDGILNQLLEKNSDRWYVLLDAAAFCATNFLDLSKFKPDFVCLSFYKMFGYPTGIGALLVRNSSSDVLKKHYYGGGTVNVSLSSTMFHVKRENLHERFEDGTIPFISIISLEYGFRMIDSISMDKISKHVFSLAKYLHHSLLLMHHSNGQPAVELYADTNYEDQNLQGGIVTFNILRSNGEYVGYGEVSNMAALYKIHLRTGCFCNPGACQRHLRLSNEDVLENYDAGYVCGGTQDLINGRPTGAVRISFGYMSTFIHVQTVLKMINDCFLDGPEMKKLPSWWKHKDSNEKYYGNSILKQEERILNKKENEQDIVDSRNDINRNNDLENNIKNETRVTLKRLFIYPIKSCGAFEIESSWILGSRGLKYDREWMVVTSSGVCLTQKQEVKLCLVKPVVCLSRNELILSFPGMPNIAIPLVEASDDAVNGKICRGKICGHKVEGTDCGVNVSEWLSLALGTPKLRLIRQNNDEPEIKDSNKPELSFVSQAQYLLINEASILWLADIVPEDADFNRNTILQRFRGNMVVSGCPAFEEINWNRILIGNSEFQVKGQCTRCQMICIDQETGLKTPEPLRSLATELHGKIRFGIYLSRTGNSEIVLKIGSNVHLVS